MRKTVLTYGLIAGGINALLMTIPALIDKDFSFGPNGMIVGYITMALAFSVIFIGTKQYRDTVNNGVITFGRAFKVAFLITLISCVIYVITWMILSATVYSDFMERYSAMMMEKARASGMSEEGLAAQQAEMEKYKEMYKNPALRALITFLEPLPLGLAFSLVTALILKRKEKK